MTITDKIITLLVVLTISASAQILQEMEYEELPAENVVLTNDKASLLIIDSTIPNLQFDSNRGIVKVDQVQTGVYHIRLRPGTQLISIMAEGYLPIQNIRYNFKAKRAWRLKVIAKPSPIQEGHGSIIIETDPPACYVTFNGIRLPDKTPLELEDQPSGIHELQLNGGFEWVQLDTVITVYKDSSVTYRYRLSNREFAHLQLISNPPGAEATLGEETLGKTPIDNNKMIAGTYMLKLELDNYYSVAKSIKLTEGEITKLNIKLPPKMGSLSLLSEQADVEILIDEVSAGLYDDPTITIDSINAGEHKVIVRKSGYHDEILTTNIQHNKTTYLKIILIPKHGSIYVTSVPPGGQFILDDSQKCISPEKIDSVTAGKFYLKGLLAGFYNIEYKGVLAPGGEENLDLTFEPKHRSGAIWRSVLLPGYGQRFAEHKTRGLITSAVQIMSVALAVYAHLDYEDKLKAYDDAYEAYLNATTQSGIQTTRLQVSSARTEWDDAAILRDIGFASVGIVYTVNLLDVALFSGGKIGTRK